MTRISMCSRCKRCENEVEFVAISTVRVTDRTFCHPDPDDYVKWIHGEPVTACDAFTPRYATLEWWDEVV
jgi:hypothetical protein